MNQETPKEAILTSISSIDFTKPFYLSRTFWVNILALACLLFPAVRVWAAENPEAPVIILSFVNLLLRTVTDKAISISDHEGRVSDDDVKSPSGGGGSLPLGILLVCSLSLLCLPSCSGITGSLSYRDAESGAKGGLAFDGEGKPHGFFRLPIFDPKTGEQVGEIQGTK